MKTEAERITIHVRLFATLRRFSTEKGTCEMPGGSKVRDLVFLLNIPEKEARLVFVNNVRSDLDTGLEDGDRVGIFPPVGGG